MFSTKLFLNPDDSSSGNAAPASAPSSSAPSASASANSVRSGTQVNSATPTTVPSVDDLFRGMENKLMGSMPDEDDVMGHQYSNNMNGEEESLDNPEANEILDQMQKGKEEEGNDDDLPLYVFKDKVGDEEIELVIENPDQLNHYLKRAAVAPKIYAENKKLQEENTKLGERAKIADEFDRMLSESPTELLNMMIEDLPEEKLIPWLQAVAAELEESQELKERRREARETAYIRQQWALQQQREQQLQQQKQAAIEQENIKQVNNWRGNEFQKWSARVPTEHHDVLKQMIDDQLLYAHRMASEGHDVDLAQLSSRLYKYVNSIVGSQKQINNKVGKATQAARQQATSKLQAATNRMTAGRQQNSEGAARFNSTDEIFDFFSRKVGTGELKARG